MHILATRDRWWMSQCDAFLLAEGIEGRWVVSEDRRAMVLDVPTSDGDRVATGLAALLAEERGRLAERRARARLGKLPPLLLQPAFIFGLGFAFLMVVVFLLTGTSAMRSHWFLAGRLERGAFLGGEWWRAVTAATLHSDVPHIAGNSGFLWILGWATAERVGSGMAALGWLLTAIAGFLVSLAFTDVMLTVGASGGLFGFLGIASVNAYRVRDRGDLARRQQLRTLGSGVLLLAFTAFSPGSNIAAHVAGFVAGGLFALLIPSRPVSVGAQLCAGAFTAALVWVCWASIGGIV
ncbi:MAG: rhomboid family intramembrane serine protease [Myxococcota bacterium]